MKYPVGNKETEVRDIGHLGNIGFGNRRLSCPLKFGCRTEMFKHDTSLESDNATDGVSCEFLLSALLEAQENPSLILSATEKALLVILDRICDGR